MGASSKSRMLLLELLLSVFIFSVCTVICTGLFMVASKTASDSRELSGAVFAAQSVAERFKADSGDIAAWAVPQSDGAYRVYYSADDYAEVTLYSEGGLIYADIAIITARNGEVYSLNIAKLTSEVRP